ncbi:ShlB/FhaC/HecB family hemolysin secretion/activation protein [Sporomusa acidovorans]|uniref:Hemolysin transporter protein ShlB n=1 Tax=Sporomusa acidovorans (strain ATCC 49682 / DSM 3132 / Mol) TaxID=1123286 RepID=A0ABZ3J599_SPOA4|nr:ShlB/FhaC/HecB family hemolysin secretion/activation protein [Sporomusa acidovorans]OZC24019.1 hemolysin transporter protein ShlB precursor [Sporomusa acidovorans DSM 3132]SDF57136.1 hemolysin activation/secretion protein [Sporomusa acidovorans]
MLSQSIKLAAALVLSVLFCTQLAWAEVRSPGETQELNRRAREEAEQRQTLQQKKDVFLQKGLTGTKDTSLPSEKLSFPIGTLTLQGERLERFPWLQPMLNQYAGRQIGKEGINLIVKRLTNELINRGYVTTRIVIPEQDLASGILRLILVPGIISEIRFDNGGQSGNWQNAFPTKPGNILNLRDLEQGLEQLKRVPSQDADFKIVPGKKPGESAIVISMKKGKDARAVLSLDDSGSKATGKLQSSVSLAFDNPFGANDLFNISFNKDAEPRDHLRGTDDYSVYYSLPSGNWTFTLSKQHHTYHQTVQLPNQTLPYSGDSDESQLKIDKLIQRDQTGKTHIEFTVTKKQSRNFAADTEIDVQHKNTTAAELAVATRKYFGRKILDLRLAYKRGVPWFGAQAEKEADMATTRYNLWTMEANYTAPVTLGKVEGRYSATLRVQSTNNVLYAVDYFSIGNRYTVRGFDGEQTLAAERGYFFRNELSVPLGRQEVYVGLDYGEVRGPAAAAFSGKALAGAAIGLRGQLQGVNYEFFSSWALKKPKEIRTKTPAIGFQLIYQI